MRRGACADAAPPTHPTHPPAPQTLNTGSLGWATALFFGYLYMVASWGGYSFIANLLPIHCLACIVFDRVSTRLYVAYAPWVILGALAAANIPVIGFNAVLMSEHMASFFVFALLHAALALQYIQAALPPRTYQGEGGGPGCVREGMQGTGRPLAVAAVWSGQHRLTPPLHLCLRLTPPAHPPAPSAAAAKRLVLMFGATAAAVVAAAVVSYVAASPTFGWTGRSLSLLDPTYASKYIPIIASVSGAPRWARCVAPRSGLAAAVCGAGTAPPSIPPPALSSHLHPLPPTHPPAPAEHQPPSWSSYFTDLHIATLLAPAGLLLCFRPLTDASLFLLLYGVTAVYFSGVMVRGCWQGCRRGLRGCKAVGCLLPRAAQRGQRGAPPPPSRTAATALLTRPSRHTSLPLPLPPRLNTPGAPYAGASPCSLLPGGPGPVRGHCLSGLLSGSRTRRGGCRRRRQGGRLLRGAGQHQHRPPCRRQEGHGQGGARRSQEGQRRRWWRRQQRQLAVQLRAAPAQGCCDCGADPRVCWPGVSGAVGQHCCVVAPDSPARPAAPSLGCRR